jgi:hypothetical protein
MTRNGILLSFARDLRDGLPRRNGGSSLIATGIDEFHAHWVSGRSQLTEDNQVLGLIIHAGMGPPSGMIDNIVSP